MGDFNLILVIVAAVVCVIVFCFNIYLLVSYQHPDDVNQAYFPKIVVVLGLTIAGISILMLPADVANRQACRHAIYNGACNLTLPMRDLWLAIYIVDAVLVFFVIPFAMFYYEGDQDKYVGSILLHLFALFFVPLTPLSSFSFASLPAWLLYAILHHILFLYFRFYLLNHWTYLLVSMFEPDRTVGKRILSAMMWVVATAIVCGLVLGILYGAYSSALLTTPVLCLSFTF